MGKYIGKRILQAIPLVILISILTFTLIQLAPYDAVDSITTPDMSAEYIEALKEEYGLNDPIYRQYLAWAKKTLSGDFGYSIVTHSNIKEALSQRIPATMLIVIPSYLVALMIAVILGLIAGAKQGTLIDKIVDGFCSITMSTPTFWMGLIFLYIFSYKLNWLPSLGMYTTGQEKSVKDLVWHMFLPCVTLTIAFLPQMIRYVRSSTIGQLAEDYVSVQRTYGATEKNILFRHVLKNALLPLITLVGMSLPMLVTGAFVTESIFSWPGVGPYFLGAIRGFDYPIILVILILSSSLVIIGNLLADILYGLIDTRIKDLGNS
ncbi:ABC transporter permease [Fusibacter ferrireducens]|uniref:ABC transporter permease n=1 Tax=Fusibacter ferrireducens TaxID=2785058 RepID=A0ABR9ZXS5_9FIRM|nr:ABC transporter permease [Fusibacter ferrireducens]MBF4694953.1 ABC transporter permease [Fusibacter ferrireducens]